MMTYRQIVPTKIKHGGDRIECLREASEKDAGIPLSSHPIVDSVMIKTLKLKCGSRVLSNLGKPHQTCQENKQPVSPCPKQPPEKSVTQPSLVAS